MITYDYYRIFYYVAKYKSFTKAAEILNNNQPNITRTINNLEGQLGCQLFLRSNHGVTLTPEGEHLYEHIAVAFRQITEAEQEIEKSRKLEFGSVSIGASETALRIYLIDRLEKFHEEYPDIKILLTNSLTPQAVDAVRQGFVDFSVVTTPLKLSKDLSAVELFQFNEILIAGNKYQFLENNVYHLSELEKYPLISLGNGTGTWELYTEFYLEKHLDFAPDMEVATTDQILPMVEHNLGIGFYPELLARQALKSGSVIEVHLEEKIPKRTVCLVKSDKQPFSIVAEKMINLLSD